MRKIRLVITLDGDGYPESSDELVRIMTTVLGRDLDGSFSKVDSYLGMSVEVIHEAGIEC